MSCHICGRSSCTPSFHSLEEQESFNDVAERVKDAARLKLKDLLDMLDYVEVEGSVYVKLDDVKNEVDDVLY